MIDYFLFLVFWAFIVGLCIGSFLNVVILRGLSGESIVFPSSKCPVCGNKLKWWMNIPLISYIFLRGKCGFCKTKISPQYPIVELFTGIIFALIFYFFGISIETLFFFIASSLIIVMSVCDIKEQVIFDLHAYILIVAGLIYNVMSGGFKGLLLGLLGGVLGFILYEALARLGYFFVRGDDSDEEEDSDEEDKKQNIKTKDGLFAAGIGAFIGFIVVACGINSVLPSIIGAILGFIVYKVLVKYNVILQNNDEEETEEDNYTIEKNAEIEESIVDEKRVFGEGDSLIAAGIGAFFGWKLLLISVLLSLVVMSAVALPYFLMHSYRLGKKRTCLAIVCEIVLIALILAIVKLNLIDTYESIIAFFAFVLLILIWSVIQILFDMNKRDKEGEISPCIMPFGPAMGVSFFIIMFFGAELLNLIKSCFGY